MSFSWKQFCQEHGIHFVTSGKNVARGHFNSKCPMCGSSDVSEHMGMSLTGPEFACWRDQSHRGRDPAVLVKAFLGCTYADAKAITGDSSPLPTQDSLSDLSLRLKALEGSKSQSKVAMQLPPDFKLLTPERPTHVAWNYFKTRGFRNADLFHIAGTYELMVGFDGMWQNRIIFPIMVNQKLKGWQGRSISRTSRLRFLTEPEDAKNHLFNYDMVNTNGDILVIVEGLFGCLKVDYYGWPHNIRACAVMGLQVKSTQIAEIYRLAPKFKKLLLLFDPGAEGQVANLASKLSIFNPVIGNLGNLSGPDDLAPDQVVPFINSQF